MSVVRVAVGVLLLLVAVACGDPGAPGAGEPAAGGWETWVLAAPDAVTVPAPPAVEPVVASPPDAAAVADRWDTDPVVRPWIELALDAIALRVKDPPASSRAYAVVSVAMYDAAVAASHWQRVHDDPGYPSLQAAIAGAASRALAHEFPEQPGPRLELLAEEAGVARVLAGERPSAVAAGLALGRAVGEAVVAYAQSDGSDAQWQGTVPEGRGLWAPPPGSVARPVAPLAGTWETWLLESGDQFRPPPPPAYDSPAFRAAAQEVADVKTRLTDEQRQLALFWEGGQGTALPAGIWNEVLLDYVARADVSVPRQARIMALVNVAMDDAAVAAWDAKYAYWTPRPENAIRDLGIDPTWEPFVPTPFFPSYVSGHATYSGAAEVVMSHLFPDDADYFHEQAEAASVSRLYGGIHYTFDNTFGLELGRDVGQLVVRWAEQDGADR